MQAQYDRLSTDEGPSGGIALEASPVNGYPPPPYRRSSIDSDGSGSDLVYRDIADEDPFEGEKPRYSADADIGFEMEPRRVSDTAS